MTILRPEFHEIFQESYKVKEGAVLGVEKRYFVQLFLDVNRRNGAAWKCWRGRKLLLYFHKKRAEGSEKLQLLLYTRNPIKKTTLCAHHAKQPAIVIPTPKKKLASSPLNRAYPSAFIPSEISQIGGKFSQVRICVTEDANKWLNTSVM